ncbi:bifunctional diguanylate cyclase/phosphodiesterase [Mycobacterium sp. 236(2023)]|uniref:putative bifunctional diguanylate cyclase/phosphodiesterase n=1 Tax=Mycobacterium sp. 236(2023) TaxID=3038163 RepID=UPI002414E13A|nr:bifunctional diguanylate cyclase/phosphodiesterase [Mycobacterium sp. 236(2023)]MDG4665121.1 bifunctional diguanylate cyclase/phosphodiesterase [Mycobacterium sp. 236(2023)]
MPNLRGVTASAAIVGGGYATWLLSGWGGDTVIRIVDNAGLVVFAAFASVCAFVASSRTRGKARAAWLSLAVGAGAWAAGEAVWSYYDLVTDRQPFPSWADAGYVMFLAGAGLCLCLLALGHPVGVQVRLALDGLIVAAAIFGAAWVTLLRPVYAAWSSSVPTLALALCYPVVDIALVTMAALLLSRATARLRPVLALLTAGLVLVMLSDIAFAYLTAAGSFGDTHWIAIGWAWGFLCLGVAALVAPRTGYTDDRKLTQSTSRVVVWLPYVPVVVSAAICTPALIVGLGPLYVAAAVTVFAVMIRQFLVLADNRRLIGKVADQAVRDPLTGLANRALFQDRLAEAVRLHQRHSLAVGVLMMDLDRFKAVNENFGYPAGDTVLVRVAERLASTVRSTDTVARFGSDEFAVLLEGDADTARALARRVAKAFERPFVIADEDLVVQPSVGLAVVPAEGSDISADELLNQADIAMQTAKQSPSYDVVVFQPHMELGENTSDTLRGDPAGLHGETDENGSERLLDELRYAIEHFELSVVYQPKFDLRTYDVVGLEALVRWPHPRRGMLTPNQFLPLVRQHGLMRSVTSLVLELALDDVARWHRKGVGVPVAINVFAPAISDPELPTQIMEALDRRALPPEMLTVEITEDLLLDNMGKTRMVFNKLRDKGIRVAIDDFGSGYSALWYLREFPIDEVKLDREFIAPILSHPASAAIVRAVIDLAHALGVTPVAEGVENTETASQLLEYGCDVAQGFLYSPPLPAPAIEKLLETHKRSMFAPRSGYASDGTSRSDIELMQ